jgi:carboxyl-terminal processing protease
MEFNKHTQGRFSGVGISIRKAAGEPIKVISPLKDTPAYRKGIRPGDMITKVDGDPTEKISITEAVRRITGPTGTTVTLTIERPGREMPFDVELVRQEIIIYTVKGHQRQDNGEWDFMIDPERKIGYVRMTNFTENTIDEMKNVIHRLRVQRGMRGLIFDLRGNPGGPLKAAIEVTDLFLDGEHRIVSTKDRHGSPWVKSSTDDAHFTGFPLIILADDSSASASEIVTGALQIHGRALVVGERTYGKGSVQQVIGLNNTNRAYLKLTTALYYLPNDRCLHREDDSEMWGVDPDIEVRLVPKEFIKMKTLQLKDDILKGKDQDALTEDQIRDVTEYGRSNDDDEEDQDEPREDKAEVAEEADDEMDACQATLEELDRDDENNFPEVDPQLETALMLMRIRLESQFPWSHETTTVAASPIGSTDG